MSGNSNSGRPRNTQTLDAIQYFMEIYSTGITTAELVAFTGLPQILVKAQLNSMLKKGEVHKTRPELRRILWHLSPPRTTPSTARLTPAVPTHTPTRSTIRSR